MRRACSATNILIAWNRSTEQARTTAFAMPLLKRAERVTILTVEGATVAGPSGEDLARSLAAHGIAAATITLPAGKGNAGETILRKAGELGCDLIVKGAYTQSRLRQMIFGGTTRHILTNANAPGADGALVNPVIAGKRVRPEVSGPMKAPEAIQLAYAGVWIASSLTLLAMTRSLIVDLCG